MDDHQIELQHYSKLTSEEWENAARERRHLIPKQLSSEQASAHVAALIRTALLSSAFGYGNYVRQKQGLKPLMQPKLPPTLADWIDSKIKAADSFSGDLGSGTYRSIANAMLTQLRSVEDWFASHKGG